MLFKIQINDKVRDGIVQYYAAAPYGRSRSFTGSGLPYFNAEMAFNPSPNTGITKVGEDGWVEIDIAYSPNSFMIGLGSVQMPPVVYLKYTDDITGDCKVLSYSLGSSIVPFRTLTYQPDKKGPEFYHVNTDPIPNSQEEFILSKAYPSCLAKSS
jgi:hypothetical protein